jgi:hypothetical protein
MVDEGSVGRGGQIEVKLPVLNVVWLEAPKCDPVGDHGRNHRHGEEGGGQRLLVPISGHCEDRADLLSRKTIGESARGHPRCPLHRRWMR